MFGNSRNRAGAKWREQSIQSWKALGSRIFIQAWAFAAFGTTILNAGQASISVWFFAPARAA
jgi:hypothetical protein